MGAHENKVLQYEALGYRVYKQAPDCAYLVKGRTGIKVMKDGSSSVMKSNEVERLLTNPEEYDHMAAKKKAAPEAAPKAPRNGVCAKVHEIAAKLGGSATRTGVVEACLKAGINKATAATQYQKWRQQK